MVLILAGAQPAAADALLEGLTGEWIGKGTGVQSTGSPSEKVYCRITNTLAEEGAVLAQEGRCAFGNDTGRLSGEIRALGGGRYDGTMTSPVMRGAAAIAGTGGDKQLDLEATYQDSKTGHPVRSVITLTVLADGQYRMVTEATDLATGALAQSSNLLFVRRPPR